MQILEPRHKERTFIELYFQQLDLDIAWSMKPYSFQLCKPIHYLLSILIPLALTRDLPDVLIFPITAQSSLFSLSLLFKEFSFTYRQTSQACFSKVACTKITTLSDEIRTWARWLTSGAPSIIPRDLLLLWPDLPCSLMPIQILSLLPYFRRLSALQMYFHLGGGNSVDKLWGSLVLPSFTLREIVIYLAVPGLPYSMWDLVLWPRTEPGPPAGSPGSPTLFYFWVKLKTFTHYWLISDIYWEPTMFSVEFQ